MGEVVGKSQDLSSATICYLIGFELRFDYCFTGKGEKEVDWCRFAVRAVWEVLVPVYLTIESLRLSLISQRRAFCYTFVLEIILKGFFPYTYLTLFL